MCLVLSEEDMVFTVLSSISKVNTIPILEMAPKGGRLGATIRGCLSSVGLPLATGVLCAILGILAGGCLALRQKTGPSQQWHDWIISYAGFDRSCRE